MISSRIGTIAARFCRGCAGTQEQRITYKMVLARGRVRRNTRGCFGLILALMLTCNCNLVSSRSIRTDDVYCPPVPASGQLAFKSVASENSACVPAAGDGLGLAVYQCWQQFLIEVNDCEVIMHPNESQLVGPGSLPCRFFHLTGNLTGAGVEALMWADVDGPALLSYYSQELQAVHALQFNTSQQLLRGLWAFLRRFTGDDRFDDDTWIGENDDRVLDGVDRSAGLERRLRSGALQQEGRQEQEQSLVARSVRRRTGPMRVYRPSQSRVMVKAPTGCKYRYTVNPSSHVFEAPEPRPHVEWRIIGLTVACLSVLLTVLGLGVCTYFSHRHAEYVACYWEYQAVKDQLGSELPPDTYQRLFGERPKSAAAAAAAIAAANAAAAAARAATAAATALLAVAPAAAASPKAAQPPGAQQREDVAPRPGAATAEAPVSVAVGQSMEGTNACSSSSRPGGRDGGGGTRVAVVVARGDGEEEDTVPLLRPLLGARG